jgi:hypothetical protein
MLIERLSAVSTSGPRWLLTSRITDARDVALREAQVLDVLGERPPDPARTT